MSKAAAPYDDPLLTIPFDFPLPSSLDHLSSVRLAIISAGHNPRADAFQVVEARALFEQRREMGSRGEEEGSEKEGLYDGKKSACHPPSKTTFITLPPLIWADRSSPQPTRSLSSPPPPYDLVPPSLRQMPAPHSNRDLETSWISDHGIREVLEEEGRGSESERERGRERKKRHRSPSSSSDQFPSSLRKRHRHRHRSRSRSQTRSRHSPIPPPRIPDPVPTTPEAAAIAELVGELRSASKVSREWDWRTYERQMAFLREACGLFKIDAAKVGTLAPPAPPSPISTWLCYLPRKEKLVPLPSDPIPPVPRRSKLPNQKSNRALNTWLDSLQVLEYIYDGPVPEYHVHLLLSSREGTRPHALGTYVTALANVRRCRRTIMGDVVNNSFGLGLGGTTWTGALALVEKVKPCRRKDGKGGNAELWERRAKARKMIKDGAEHPERRGEIVDEWYLEQNYGCF